MALLKVDVEHFRGVPGALALNLPVRDGAALLLVGDNGTGKSTIADAIEVGLQARLGRSTGSLGRRARSHATDSPPRIRLTFDDGTTITRQFEVREDGRVILHGRDPAAGYAIAPVVLRRPDIVGFWEVPERQRQVVFLDYVGTLRSDGPREGIERLEDERAARKVERDDLRERLATVLGIPAEGIPMDVRGLDQYIREVLAARYDARTPTGLYFPPRIWGPLNAYKSAVTRVKRTTDRLTAERLRVSEMPEDAQETAAQLLERAGAQLTESYRAITGDDWVRDVRVTVGDATEASLLIDLHLANGRTLTPNMLSEAKRDLIALLLFISLAISAHERGQKPFLVLDDVFHSVDATVRVRALGTILGALRGWQLVLTTHDRLWAEQARRALIGHGFQPAIRELSRWSFDEGPVIRAAASGPRERLERHLEHGEPRDIVAIAGVIVEQMCDVLSWTLRAQVVRQEADRYTIGDLWPGVLGKLRTTDARPVADAVDELGYFRNLAGAHYNEPAEQLSMEEARDYGLRVRALLDRVYCQHCTTWIRRRGSDLQCSCGRTVLQRTS